MTAVAAAGTRVGEDATVRAVRARLKEHFRDDPAFLAAPPAQQMSIYRDALSRGVELARRRARGLAEGDVPEPTRLQDVGELAGGFLDEVDFPTFVRDLITGTYGSIVASTIQQMDAYAKMYKELAKPLGAIAREISDTDALGEVAASDPLRFTMTGDGELNDNQTNMKVDTSNDEIQRLMFEAKLKLARERRLLMRETMLMGVQRLIVEKGTIRAGLLFNVRATEASESRNRTTDIQQEGGQLGGSYFGLFGGGKSNRKTRISVSSRQLQTNTELTAQISGFVEVNFKSDVFNLNNFADLFGDESTQAVIAQRQGQGGQQRPPPAQVPQTQRQAA